MSKELVKNGQKYLVNSSDQSLRKDVGEFALTTGAGGLVLAGVAWMLPFVTFPMLLIAMVIFGVVLYAK